SRASRCSRSPSPGRWRPRWRLARSRRWCR
ncbi:MAG: hypothetical protein AMXMBFR72_14940, partial [Betaproteobacteria bacterium]